MTQQGSALALSAAAVGVSMVYQIRHDADPIPVFVFGGIYTGVVVLVSSVNPDVGTALAAVFFLGMFLTRGSELIDWTNDAVKGTANHPDKPKKRKAHQ